MKYLNLDFKTGSFYEYSKEKKEGFEEHLNKDDVTVYRKYYKKGVTGTLESVGIYEGFNGNQELSININMDGETHACKVSLKDSSKMVDSNFAEDIIKVLVKLEKGMNLTVSPYNFIPKGEAYSKRGISFKSNGVKIDRALSNSYYKDGKLVEGDIPAIVWTKNKQGKSELDMISAAMKSKFLLDYLDANLNHLAYDGTPSQEEVKVEEDTDSLPF